MVAISLATNAASTFSWLDYSERDRRRTLEAVNALRDRDTRDELGIGAIRDAVADTLFPGTGTMQTRARYFLFIPWLYQRLPRDRGGERVADRARRAEIDLIAPLLASDDPYGTIGTRSKSTLQRLPSSVYWLGLERWGIRLYPGTQSQFHRHLGGSAAHPRLRNADGEPVDDGSGPDWHPGLPKPPADFPRCASPTLRYEDAEYLRERLLSNEPQSLLAFLVDRGRLEDQADFPWEHPQLAEFPRGIRERLDHAREFSEAIAGAPYLYNMMLAEHTGNSELVDVYRGLLAEWTEMIENQLASLRGWDHARFWELAASGGRIGSPTRHFVENWLDLVSDRSAKVVDDPASRALIREREHQLKRSLARLDYPPAKAREIWSGAAGVGRVNYRWPIAQQMVRDILTGIASPTDDAGEATGMEVTDAS